MLVWGYSSLRDWTTLERVGTLIVAMPASSLRDPAGLPQELMTLAVRVRRGMVDHMVAYSGHCQVQIQDADDAAAASRALRAVIEDLESLPHPDEPGGSAPSFLSVEPDTEGGPMLVVDMHDLDELMPTVLDLVKRRLAEAGVKNAVVGWPHTAWPAERGEDRQRWDSSRADRPVGWYRVIDGELHLVEGLRDQIPRDQVPAAVILRVFAAPAASVDGAVAVPDAWMAEGTRWVTRDLHGTEWIWVSSELGDQFRIPASSAIPFLEAHRRKYKQCHLVSGRLDGRVRAVNAAFSKGSANIAIATGGPATSRDEMVEAAEELIAVARRVASTAAYAYLTMLPTFGRFWEPIPTTSEWSEVTARPERDALADAPTELVAKYAKEYCGGVPRGARTTLVSLLCDEFIFDAHPYQVLGPGHMRRLGQTPPGSRDLGGGRMELQLGDLRSWLPIRPADHMTRRWWVGLDLSPAGTELQANGRSALARCLLMADEACALRDKRYSL